jgi:hypothetical protein
MGRVKLAATESVGELVFRYRLATFADVDIDVAQLSLNALWTNPKRPQISNLLSQDHSGLTVLVDTIEKAHSTCLSSLGLIVARYHLAGRLILNISDHTISKFQSSFLGSLTNYFPAPLLSPQIRCYLSSSFAHNTVINTSSPPHLVKVLRILQQIGLSSMVERELSVVVTDKVREFINIETKGDWKRRYATRLSEWVDKGLADLLRFVLGRQEGECVGEDALKTIALRALTDLRYCPERTPNGRIDELFDIIKEFPESASAIEDLKMSIETPGQRDHLVTVFRQSYLIFRLR